MTISVDDDVALLTEQVEELKRLGIDGPAGDGEVYDFSIRWGTALAGRLPRLIHYYRLGALSNTDAHRVRTLWDELRAVSALAAGYGLACPALPEPAVDPDRY